MNTNELNAALARIADDLRALARTNNDVPRLAWDHLRDVIGDPPDLASRIDELREVVNELEEHIGELENKIAEINQLRAKLA